jgi:predicted MFS family arabinose efflux permease
MICFGIVNAIAAPATGSIVKLTGRVPVMLFAFVLHIGILIALLWWRPQPQQGFVFFLVSGLWGICDAIWLVQVNGKLLYDFYDCGAATRRISFLFFFFFYTISEHSLAND